MMNLIYILMNVPVRFQYTCQFEAGQQRNGHYFCLQCPLNAKKAPNLVYAMSQPNTSLEKIKTKTT